MRLTKGLTQAPVVEPTRSTYLESEVSGLASMIRHPIQRQQTTGGRQGPSPAVGVDLGQQLGLAEAAGSRDPIQHGPELRL